MWGRGAFDFPKLRKKRKRPCRKVWSDSRLAVKKPKEIENLTIEKTENTVTIKNTNLNLEKIYKNYTEHFSNLLFLDSFSKELELENTDINIKENSIILELKNSINSTYRKYTELELDKRTMKPINLEVKDENKKTVICILYTDIEIN